MKNFRNIITTILQIMVGFIDCSKDPASPSNNEQTKPIVTATIGAGGGHIGTENISIIIPAGAFNANHDIALYDIADDLAFGENTVSTSYKISGLPNEYQQPLKITMKYNGELSEQSFIAIGENTLDSMSGDSSTVYNLYPASDSSGYLTGELPAVVNVTLAKPIGASATSDDNFEKQIKSVTGYKWMRTEKFSIRYPASLESSINYVGEILEAAHKIVFDELGLSFNSKFKFNQWIANITSQIPSVTSNFAFNLPLLNISRERVADSYFNEIKIAAGSRMIDAVIREIYKSISVNPKFGSHLWLDRAITNWSEELFTDDSDFKYPRFFRTYEMAPFTECEQEPVMSPK